MQQIAARAGGTL